MQQYIYRLEMAVRDYELDTQGVVNNAVYQNYLEHARHEFLKETGLNFNALHARGTDAVVHKIEMEFKKPLVGNDRFEVKMDAFQEGNVRFKFVQDIYRIPDNQWMLKATVTVVFMKNGRPIRPPQDVVNALLTFRAAAAEKE